MEQAQPKRKKYIGLWILLGVLLVVLGFMIFLYRIIVNPESMFESAEVTTPAPTDSVVAPVFDIARSSSEQSEQTDVSPTVPPLPNDTKSAEASVAPTAEPTQQPMDNIVNIMLMGIDAFENGNTTSGEQPHTDVMMVIAVNFDRDVVDLITLPRDTFTTAPGINGFYKLNGVFNAGGGMEDMESGFALTCKAAEIWLGGISIPYYYALDFKAVVDIVDAIGGIDYDVDQKFRAAKIVGNKMDDGKLYDVGMHHLDGAAVLGYLRIRHAADGLDSSRTARQRRMMVAIFNKLKSEGKLTQIPELINAATSGIYTNTTLAQTTSLANYAMTNIKTDQIRTRSMYGDIWYQHYFKYCFIDQQNRIDLIKEVYGLDVKPVGLNTPQYENWLYDIGFLSIKHRKQAEKVLEQIQIKKDAGQTFTEEQVSAYTACYNAYVLLNGTYEEYSKRMQNAYVDSSMSESEIKALEKEVKATLSSLNNQVKTATLDLAHICDIHVKLEWTVGTRWFVDGDINERFVAFG